VTGHEKECALAAYAALIERAVRDSAPAKEIEALRREYRLIAATPVALAS
jgi:hypothetical protein